MFEQPVAGKVFEDSFSTASRTVIDMWELVLVRISAQIKEPLRRCRQV